MLFNDIIGQEHIKNYLIKTVENGIIPHTQLFYGKEGVGTLPMAIAYAQHLLCHFNNSLESCKIKCRKLQHPDLHFTFPISTDKKFKKKPLSDNFINDWRSFFLKNPYGSLFDWYRSVGIEKKQGQIGVDQAEEIIKKLTLKSYDGGFKIMIIWMAEKMNLSASNKLLKLIEEPPEKTVFILICEDKEQIIKTISSRCQTINFPLLSENSITKKLIQTYKLSKNEATIIANQSQGNYNKTIHLLNNDSKDIIFEQWFIFWIRAAFKAKGNASVIIDLIKWSEKISKEGREVQKQFLQYCLSVFRQALLLNYNAKKMVFLQIVSDNFKLEKFAPFVHSNNILLIEKELNLAQYHIESNGNAKIILLDLSIKLTRILHIKENNN